MNDLPMVDTAPGRHPIHVMAVDQFQLAQLLSLAALVACTIEYSSIMQRRVHRRRIAAEHASAHLVGLQGLVRVFEEG